MEGTLDVTVNTMYGTLSVQCTLYTVYSMSGLCAKYVNKSQTFTIASALAVTGLVFYADIQIIFGTVWLLKIRDG